MRRAGTAAADAPGRPRRQVLLVGKGPPEVGGIPAYLTAVLDSRLAETYELSLCNLTDDASAEGGRLSAENLRRMWRDLRRVWRAASGRDVVHIHTALAPTVTCLRAGALAALARLRAPRVIVHIHGGLVASWMVGRVRRAAARAALAPATSIVTVCAAGEQAVTELIGPTKVELVDNGIDVHRVPARAARSDVVPRVVFAGLLSERKGLLELFEASRRLHREGLVHELVVAGGNHEEGPAEEARMRQAGADVATFTGQLDRAEVMELLTSSDVLCLPSWVEAMPLILLEAMAAGVAVVASEVGDIPRVVIDGETGRLVPPRDTDALVDALRSLLQDAEGRARLASAGREHVATSFSLDRTLSALDRLYR
ncbi:glycosyltransferase family 4 protein [Egicoccus sp. AB-alg2]|uniref:glycosyltransferase family 4 protein n=1 Tax=Egicoccus sp. AB-alg2 TaxID=3242693 RepID=UPI00359EC3FD